MRDGSDLGVGLAGGPSRGAPSGGDRGVCLGGGAVERQDAAVIATA